MINQTRWIRKNDLLLVGLLLAITACGDDSGGSGPEDPDLYNVGDYLMNQCTVYHDLWWSDCRTAEEWSLRPNQPVFTALNDCLIAKGHEQDEDSTVWDDSQEDRDRGWAMLVVCSPVVGG
jgi:hypothetical protein